MTIDTQSISALRAKTGAGMMEVKKALDETGGDITRAEEILRKKGLAKAAKRADKVAAEGRVEAYIHGEGRIGVLLELNCETDFVAKNDGFKIFARDIAMHIAASAPQHLSRVDVPSEVVEKEKEIYRAQMGQEKKPPEIVEKIIEGKVKKFFAEVCLLEQAFIKDETKTIEQLITEKTAEIGEKITIRRFARFVVGEGIEKKNADFAEEVAAQLG